MTSTVAPSGECVDFLRETEMFRGLPEAALQAVATSVTEVSLRPGELLFRQGDTADAIYIVQEGRLLVFTEDKDVEPRALEMIEAGRWVGEGALIMAGSRAASVRASMPSRLLRLSAVVFDATMAAYPSLRQVLGGLVASRLPGLIDATLVSELRSHLSWVRLARGELLFNAGDAADAVYVVARGRLGGFRVDSDDGGEELVVEIPAGEPVGEIELLTKEPRAMTVRALRNSEVVRLSAEGFDTTIARSPQALVPLTRTLAVRLRALATGTHTRAAVRTIALVPVDASIPMEALARNIEQGLRDAGAVLNVGADYLEQIHAGAMAASTGHTTLALRLTDWLTSAEGGHDFVLYRCDPGPSLWTKLCIGRADRVLVVARAKDQPTLGSVQRQVEEVSPSSRELVLLHDDGSTLPSGTAAWLRLVAPARHHHVRLDHPEDALRVARFLNRRAVGVVFGGGGARGYAHAGVLRALREQRIAIDFVGGVSMGSMPAAILALGQGHPELMSAFKRVFVDPNRPTKPYTLPLLSIFSMHRAERALHAVFGDTQIEDLWLNYFCVATDITAGEARVFREGTLWRAMRASGSFPGLFPPLPDAGHLLVDGGVLTNLPVALMQKLCPGPVIASDVSKDADVEMMVDATLTAAPSLSHMLWAMMNPFAPRLKFPNLTAVLSRSLAVREAGERAQLRRSTAYCFVPPVARFALDQIRSLDEIASVGYEYAAANVREIPASVARSSAEDR
jgi:predicted acylesterase/phospholipase RssA/CRP-like cAMP-binding protein